jgi:hypothetical protein
MATVATVYSIEGQVRNAEAIMGLKNLFKIFFTKTPTK